MLKIKIIVAFVVSLLINISIYSQGFDVNGPSEVNLPVGQSTSTVTFQITYRGTGLLVQPKVGYKVNGGTLNVITGTPSSIPISLSHGTNTIEFNLYSYISGLGVWATVESETKTVSLLYTYTVTLNQSSPAGGIYNVEGAGYTSQTFYFVENSTHYFEAELSITGNKLGNWMFDHWSDGSTAITRYFNNASLSIYAVYRWHKIGN